jgi:hypothetical protein
VTANTLKSSAAPLCAAICALGATVRLAQADTSRWYLVSQIGMHVGGEKRAERLDRRLAFTYFETSAGKLSKAWLTRVHRGRQLVARSALPKHVRPHEAANARPFARVRRFNHRQAEIEVLRPLGSHRWHHYFHRLALYLVDRTTSVDQVFELPALEKKLGFRFRDLGHGTPAFELYRILGQPDERNPTQTLSLERVYYRSLGLHVELHEAQVYFLERRRPGWQRQP